MNDSIDPNDQLRRRLRAGADAIDLQPDWNDVTIRLGRSYRRRVRMIGGAAAFALLAGVTGGFLAGRQSSDDGNSVAAAPGAGDSQGQDSDTTTQGAATTIAPSYVPYPGAVDAGSSVMVSSSGRYDTEIAATRLFIRDSAGGVAVRLYRQEYNFETDSGYAVDTAMPYPDTAHDTVPPQGMWPPQDWQPASWCNQNGDLLAEVSTTDVAGVAYGGWWSELPPDSSIIASYQVLGVAEQAPIGVVVVQVSGDIAEVRATFADGSVDSMAPVEGAVALAMPGAFSWEDSVTVDAVGADGAVVATETAGGPFGMVGVWDHPECQPPPPPPPELPEAGEQPADPAAAESGVRTAIETVFATDGVERTEEEAAAYRDEKLALIDDTEGVEDAMNQLGEAYPGIVVTPAVTDLVFRAPDRATVLFSLETSITDFDNRLGELVLVDGTWKVTRATVCDALSMGGGYCDGDPALAPDGPPIMPVTTVPTTAGG